MKKIMYILGSILLIMTPSVLLSCSGIKAPKGQLLADFIKSGLKIKINERINVKNDEVILFKQYYTGRIHDKFDDKNDGAAVLGTSSRMNFSGSKGIVTMGENDSLIFLYNDDNNDGLSLSNFRETVQLLDTSIMSSMIPILKALNIKIGPFGSAYIPFKGSEESGSLFRYIGSQNNHSKLTWKQAMLRCKEVYSAQEYTKIEEYYKEHSHSFIPVPIPKNTITYKRVGVNAMEVTFSGKAPITGAGIRIKPINKAAKIISPFSIGGPNEWKSYYTPAYANNLLGDHLLGDIN